MQITIDIDPEFSNVQFAGYAMRDISERILGWNSQIAYLNGMAITDAYGNRVGIVRVQNSETPHIPHKPWEKMQHWRSRIPGTPEFLG